MHWNNGPPYAPSKNSDCGRRRRRDGDLGTGLHRLRIFVVSDADREVALEGLELQPAGPDLPVPPNSAWPAKSTTEGHRGSETGLKSDG